MSSQLFLALVNHIDKSLLEMRHFSLTLFFYLFGQSLYLLSLSHYFLFLLFDFTLLFLVHFPINQKNIFHMFYTPLPFQQLQPNLKEHHPNSTLHLTNQTDIFSILVEPNINSPFLAVKRILQSSVRLFVPCQLMVDIISEQLPAIDIATCIHK